VSTLTGIAHPNGTATATNALAPRVRAFSTPYLLHEATTSVALRNTR
jgi:hypothetical protein